MYVIKASGGKEEFNPEKIRNSLARANVDRTISDDIIKQVEKEAFDGITTAAIFKRVMELLKNRSPARASCYDLKDAIKRLGPAGFPFETFIAEILKENGYKTMLRTRLRGKCAECMNIRLLCWRHPRDRSLEKMIAEKNLYPITILQSAGPDIIKRFSKAGYILVKDLLQEDFRKIGRKTGLKERKIRELVDEAREICC